MFLKELLLSKERKKILSKCKLKSPTKTKQRKTLIEETSTENLETLENDCNSVVDENGCNFEKIQNRFRDSVKWSIIHPVHRRFSNTLYNV